MPGSGEGDVETLTPEEAFRLFGHDLRIDVLLALWRAPDHSLSYSELREAVGERDSGKFNYHLSKLVDRFVEHADDEYRLRYAGHRVIDAIQNGVFQETPTVGPVELDAACPSCGSPLTFDYADHNGSVRCPDCGTSVLDYAFDPGGVAERTPDEVIDALTAAPVTSGDSPSRGSVSSAPVASKVTSSSTRTRRSTTITTSPTTPP